MSKHVDFHALCIFAVFLPYLWSSHKALVVIDVQNDFISGTLAVQTSEDIVTIINDIRDQFDCAPCLEIRCWLHQLS